MYRKPFHSTMTEAPPAASRTARVTARLARAQLARLLRPLDIELDGTRPFDPKIRNPRFCARVLAGGALAAGEAYVDGDWDCDALDELVTRVLRHRLDERLGLGLTALPRALLERVWNPQSIQRAAANSRAHYDRGDDLYQAMLGPTMIYSCGYWAAADSLDEAQQAKLALICKKLDLHAGQRVLDVGCGWGAFARFAAEHCGAEVVGITVSPAQAEAARARCRGLSVDIRLQDYRQIDETFDRVVSVGMFEHVGPRNHVTFMRRMRDCLRPDGLFLLHTIGSLRSGQVMDPWVAKYIFPGAALPSAAEITAACEGSFVIEDWHNFGGDYDPTLRAWWRNFERAWPSLSSARDERFFRMWRYYLLTSAGSFRARTAQLWQIVLARTGVPGGYRRP